MKYLVITVFMAATLRLGLSGFPLHQDELATTSIFAQLPFLQIFINYQYPNNHIFHTVLVHFLLETFGLQEPILRLPVLLASFLSLIYAYQTAHLMTGNRWSALLVVLFLSFSYGHLYFSTNARGYMIITLIAQIIIHWLVQQYRLENPLPLSWSRWGGMTLMLVIGTWTVPTFALFEASLMMWAVCFSCYRWWQNNAFSPTRRRPFFQTSWSACRLEMQLLATGLFGLGMVYVQYGVIIPRKIFRFALGDPNVDANYFDYMRDVVRWLGNGLAMEVVTLVLITIGFITLFRARSRSLGLLGCVALGVVFPVVAAEIGLLKGMPPTRVFLYMQPMLAIVAVMGIQALARGPVWFPRIVGILVACLVVEGGWTYYTRLWVPYRERPDYQQVRQFIKQLGPHDLFISSDKTHVWMYLYGNPGMRDRVLNILNSGKLDNIYFLESQESDSSDLSREVFGNVEYLRLEKQRAANNFANQRSIPIPLHFSEPVQDWGVLRIYRIQPHLIHPKFSVFRDSVEEHFKATQPANIQVIPTVETREDSKELHSVLLVEGPQQKIMLFNPNESKISSGQPLLNLNLLYTSASIRDKTLYASGHIYPDGQLYMSPAWLLNLWTVEHPYGDVLYERSWFPRLFLTASLYTDDYLILEDVPAGKHGLANMHSFWIGEL